MYASTSALHKSTALKDADISAAPLELAVVIPTFEERENIWPVLDRLAEALTGIHYEVIFVDDDSRDGTADCIREIARVSTNVHVLQRVHRRGLGSACIEGMMATAAPYIAVIDADLQHDERILPEMFAKLQTSGTLLDEQTQGFQHIVLVRSHDNEDTVVNAMRRTFIEQGYRKFDRANPIEVYSFRVPVK